MRSFCKLLLLALAAIPAAHGSPALRARASHPAPKPSLAEADCRTWASGLEASLALGDPTFLNRSLDLDALCARIEWPDHLPPQLRALVISGVKKRGLRDMSENLCATLGKDGSYRLLAVRRSGRGWRALFRVLGVQGHDYQEFLLEAGPDGKPHASDLYLASTDEWISKAMGRILSSLMVQSMDARSLSPDILEAMKPMADFQQHMTRKEWTLATGDLDKLPRRLQGERWVRFQRLLMATHLGPAAYLAQLEAFQAAYSGDHAAWLLAITYHTLRKDYGAVLVDIEGLRRFLGVDDPYLDILAAKARHLKGDSAAARLLLEKALVAEPDLKAGQDLRLDIALALGRHAEVIECLEVLEGRFNMKLSDLTLIPVFSAFVKSSEYSAWKQGREAQASPQAPAAPPVSR